MLLTIDIVNFALRTYTFIYPLLQI